MHQLHDQSVQLEKAMEQHIQNEQNEQRKSQVQTLLQQQRNISGSLKSMSNQSQQEKESQNGGFTANYTTEFASESHVNANDVKKRQQRNATQNDENKDSSK